MIKHCCEQMKDRVLLLHKNEADTDENKEIELGITAKSAVLMEVSTGKVIYEKNSQEIPSAI